MWYRSACGPNFLCICLHTLIKAHNGQNAFVSPTLKLILWLAWNIIKGECMLSIHWKWRRLTLSLLICFEFSSYENISSSSAPKRWMEGIKAKPPMSGFPWRADIIYACDIDLPCTSSFKSATLFLNDIFMQIDFYIKPLGFDLTVLKMAIHRVMIHGKCLNYTIWGAWIYVNIYIVTKSPPNNGGKSHLQF